MLRRLSGRRTNQSESLGGDLGRIARWSARRTNKEVRGDVERIRFLKASRKNTAIWWLKREIDRDRGATEPLICRVSEEGRLGAGGSARSGSIA